MEIFRPKKQTTKPSDYPIFAFRLSKEDKIAFEKDVEEILAVLNSDGVLPKDSKTVRKNQVLIMALTIGLSELRKKHSRHFRKR